MIIWWMDDCWSITKTCFQHNLHDSMRRAKNIKEYSAERSFIDTKKDFLFQQLSIIFMNRERTINWSQSGNLNLIVVLFFLNTNCLLFYCSGSVAARTDRLREWLDIRGGHCTYYYFKRKNSLFDYQIAIAIWSQCEMYIHRNSP